MKGIFTTIFIFVILVVSTRPSIGQSKELLVKKELKRSAESILTEGEARFEGPLRLAFGDLTGDGVEEVVALYRGSRPGSRIEDEVRVFEFKDNSLHLITRFNASPDGQYALSIASFNTNFKVENGMVVIDQAVLGKGGRLPTHYQTVRYTLENGRLTESERSKRKPLEEHMREIG